MTFEDIEFPVYRKYKNGKNFFKIINARKFEEIMLIGQSAQLREVSATQFPEQNFIRDLVLNFSEMAFEINGDEYERVRAKTGENSKF